MCNLTDYPDWPRAFDQISGDLTEEDLARYVIECTVEESLQGKTVLNYGRGAGPLGLVISEYGVAEYAECGLVPPPGEFDVVLVHDVIDHSELPMTTLLSRIHSSLTPTGRAYIRFHPFFSRHALHVHELGLNLAYAHLELSEEELAPHKPRHCRRVVNPVAEYNRALKDAGLEVIYEDVYKESVEPVFLAPPFSILQKFPNETAESLTAKMKIQFVDYVVRR